MVRKPGNMFVSSHHLNDVLGCRITHVLYTYTYLDTIIIKLPPHNRKRVYHIDTIEEGDVGLADNRELNERDLSSITMSGFRLGFFSRDGRNAVPDWNLGKVIIAEAVMIGLIWFGWYDCDRKIIRIRFV